MDRTAPGRLVRPRGPHPQAASLNNHNRTPPFVESDEIKIDSSFPPPHSSSSSSSFTSFSAPKPTNSVPPNPSSSTSRSPHISSQFPSSLPTTTITPFLSPTDDENYDQQRQTISRRSNDHFNDISSANNVGGNVGNGGNGGGGPEGLTAAYSTPYLQSLQVSGGGGGGDQRRLTSIDLNSNADRSSISSMPMSHSYHHSHSYGKIPSLKDRLTKMDPYVVVCYQDQRVQTDTVLSGGTDCVFTKRHKNILKFYHKSHRTNQDTKLITDEKTMIVKVFDQDWGLSKDELIGRGEIDISTNCENPGQDDSRSCRLEDKNQKFCGRVDMKVVYKSSDLSDDPEGIFHITIQRCCQLKDTPFNFNTKRYRKTFLITLIAILSYLVVGVLFYTLAEERTTVEALYFSIGTLTTIGHGGAAPVGTSQQLFSCFYIIIAMLLIGIGLGAVGAYFLEKQEKAIIHGLTGSKDFTEYSYRSLVVSMMAFIVAIFAGALFFTFQNERNFVDAFYLTFASLSTVGYSGDFHPSGTSQQLFFVFWVIFGLTALIKLFADCLDVYFMSNFHRIAQRILKTSVHSFNAEKMALNEDPTKSVVKLLDSEPENEGSLDRFEFLSKILVKMGTVSQYDIDEIMDQYNATTSSHADVNGINISGPVSRLFDINEQI